jgi:hypothetical protein
MHLDGQCSLKHSPQLIPNGILKWQLEIAQFSTPFIYFQCFLFSAAQRSSSPERSPVNGDLAQVASARLGSFNSMAYSSL